MATPPSGPEGDDPPGGLAKRDLSRSLQLSPDPNITQDEMLQRVMRRQEATDRASHLAFHVDPRTIQEILAELVLPNHPEDRRRLVHWALSQQQARTESYLKR